MRDIMGYTSLHIWYPDNATYFLAQPSQWIIKEGRWLQYLIPPTGRLKEILHITLLLCMSAAWSFQTIQDLRFETAVAEVYYSELLRVTPKYYNGLL